jgi:5-methylcytosine-specific restriction endonuclease McrA
MARKKVIKTISEIMAASGNCKIPGCGRPITVLTGTCSESLCDFHLEKDHSRGGMGRLNKPYTYHREFVCDHCGFDFRQHPIIKNIQDKKLQNRVLRSCIVADHMTRRVDGGDDSKENIQSLCRVCDAIKTTLDEDYRAGTRTSKNTG